MLKDVNVSNNPVPVALRNGLKKFTELLAECKYLIYNKFQ